MSQLVTGVRNQAIQQIESLVYVAQNRIVTGNVILGEDIVRIDGQGSRCPISGAISLAERGEGRSAQIGRPRVFRVNREFTLRPFDTPSSGILAVSMAAKRPISRNQQAQ